MRRAVSILVAVVAVGFASQALARPKLSLKGLIAVKATSSAARAAMRRNNAVAEPEATESDNRLALSPALLSPPPAPATVAATTSAANTPDQFRARCDAAKGVVVGVVTHGFCIIN